MNIIKKMRQLSMPVLALMLIFASYSTVADASELAFQESASEIIMNSLQEEPKQGFLQKLYTRLFFVPVWMRELALSPAAHDLLIQIKNDQTLNKTGKLYQDTLLLEERADAVYSSDGTVAQKMELEFKFSHLYHTYTNYAYLGSINWGAFRARIDNLRVNDVKTEWILHRPEVDAIAMVENAALGGSLLKQLKDATPKQYRYEALQKALARYREIKENGGWEAVSLSKTLSPGKRAKGVDTLRERLRITGDYTPCGESSETLVYDVCLQKAVKHFQIRNGLTPDAIVGPETLLVLNKTVDDRITTILLNLDRIKWLKPRHSKRHIIINIPDFMLYFEEDGELKERIRTIVGKPKNPTPIFSNRVKFIVLNPYWNIPKSIIQKEMIPKLLKDVSAMEKQQIEIYTGWGKNAKKIPANLVDWSQYRYSKSMPFRFAQVPGVKNALGKLKFLFPNKYAVYMHDTPTKSLFLQHKRAFSHGCIRLQKPRELLKIFSTFNENVDFEKSQQVLKGKKNTSITLQNSVPIDVVYLTSWVDYDGKLQFREDIYGYDEMQLKSFRRW